MSKKAKKKSNVGPTLYFKDGCTNTCPLLESGFLKIGNEIPSGDGSPFVLMTWVGFCKCLAWQKKWKKQHCSASQAKKIKGTGVHLFISPVDSLPTIQAQHCIEMCIARINQLWVEQACKWFQSPADGSQELQSKLCFFWTPDSQMGQERVAALSQRACE